MNSARPTPPITPMPGARSVRYPYGARLTSYANSPIYSTRTPPNFVITPEPESFNYANRVTSFIGQNFKDIHSFAKLNLSRGESSILWLYHKVYSWSRKWFTHCFLAIIVIMYTLLGAWLLRLYEAERENLTVLNLDRRETEFLEKIHLLYKDRQLLDNKDEWIGRARFHLRELKNTNDFQVAMKTGIYDATSETKKWTWGNAIFFCATVYTTIGYGHIAPVTFPGRIITIIYSIIGIPLFLILLADFGKMFTRSIKFMWAFVRRLYYTGSCRRVRKNSQVQGVLKGIGMAYDVARKHSMMMNGPPTVDELAEAERQTNITDPTTPIPQEMLIDDEFNLPISLAIFILISYELVGAILYAYAENWSIMDSFYFVFISMSTIGFGDIVPSDPIAMVLSIAYLAFGLALTSMCINVVQLKLTDSFRHATLKLSHTIGLGTPDMGEFDENGEEGTEIDSNHLNVPPVLILKDPPTAPMRKKSRVESPTEISLSSRDT